MNKTATEILQDEYNIHSRTHSFLHQLQRFLRENARVVALKFEDEPLPEHDVVLEMPLDDSLQSMLREHMELILTLLPEEVVVVDRATLGLMASCIKTDESFPNFADGSIYEEAVTRAGAMYVQRAAYLAQHERQEREREGR